MKIRLYKNYGADHSMCIVNTNEATIIYNSDSRVITIAAMHKGVIVLQPINEYWATHLLNHSDIGYKEITNPVISQRPQGTMDESIIPEFESFLSTL